MFRYLCRSAWFVPLLLHSSESLYLGSAACGECHREIAAAQGSTRMARTWQGPNGALLPTAYSRQAQEGAAPAIRYSVRRNSGSLSYEVAVPAREPFLGTVETTVGGSRHGLSFLVRVPAIEGLPLARPPLVEGRYLHSTPRNELVLSPGFPESKPESYETAIGRALSPQFERKCLACHGAVPEESPSEAPGVHCEACHGPGRSHPESVARGKPREGIVNPARLEGEPKLATCAPCHSGFSEISDPLPDDLLISNQVTALKNSECYLQSGKKLTCTNCHDPHQDSAAVSARSIDACLSCHSPKAQPHAALCPVNRKEGCVGCHMPAVSKGSFHLTDHWIRVNPEQPVAMGARQPEWKTQLQPRREFLRMIVTEDGSKASEARQRLTRGASFFDVASEYSTDPTGPGGGYLGEMWLEQMDPALASAAAKLSYGETSPVISGANKYFILQRLPRDFKFQADRVQRQASELRKRGALDDAVRAYTESLRIYPQFLRSLIFLGSTLGEQGNAQRAAGVLEFAARLYPRDPAAQYNLGIAYGALGRSADEIAAYRRAIDLEPDLVSAYQNLGGALLAAGQPDQAAEAYERGLDMNPLSVVLYYNLSLVRRQQNRDSEAAKALGIARTIDPAFVRKQEGGL